MDNHLVLKYGSKYYASEGVSTHHLEEALKIKSINELITTVPIMKDWNWDYEVYEVRGTKLKKIKESKWINKYREWKKENPEAHSELYE